MVSRTVHFHWTITRRTERALEPPRIEQTARAGVTVGQGVLRRPVCDYYLRRKDYVLEEVFYQQLPNTLCEKRLERTCPFKVKGAIYLPST